jgi:hypothetical protein
MYLSKERRRDPELPFKGLPEPGGRRQSNLRRDDLDRLLLRQQHARGIRRAYNTSRFATSLPTIPPRSRLTMATAMSMPVLTPADVQSFPSTT